jgi:hypothetical protein
MPITTPEHYIQHLNGDSDHFQHVLEHLFIPAVEGAGLTPIPPVVRGNDLIHAELIKNLENADLVLCDMSSLNPNVFFELGIRTALNKPVSIVKDDNTKKIPFDTSIINIHTYSSSLEPWTLEENVNNLTTHLNDGIEKGEPENSLWKYFGAKSQANLNIEQNPDDQMNLLLKEVEGLRRDIRSEKASNRIKSGEDIREGVPPFNYDPRRGSYSRSDLALPGPIMIDRANRFAEELRSIFSEFNIDYELTTREEIIDIILLSKPENLDLIKSLIRETGMRYSIPWTLQHRY